MKNTIFHLGSVVAAFLASACCILPLTFSILGLGGFAFAAALEPYRPIFIGVTVIFLGFGFYYTYRPNAADCGPGEECEIPVRRKWQRLGLWIVAGLTLLLIAAPYLLALIG